RFDAMTIEKLSNPVRLPGPTGEDNQLSLLARGAMVLVIREQDPIDVAEQQITCALLCGCPIIMAADRSHWVALEQMRERYQQAGISALLLQLMPIEGLNGIVQNNRIEGVIANSLNTDSSKLRQIMASRTGSIIPLIEWPADNSGYHYHWLLWFLSERTKTENLVARGGNTQLFNLQD
ncbi:MAG: bifunctional proline dehydrogenase/L-glutamate gamma-semialdehyde dehydrogenase, partial [Porticoccaceae bacterium]